MRARNSLLVIRAKLGMNTIPSHIVFAGTQQRDKYQRQQDSRKGNNDIVYAHQDFVNPSAKIPGERTDKNTNGSAEQQSSESDEEGCTGSF